MSVFTIKPSLGWIHPNELIRNEGVTYTATYIGCTEVTASMKQLSFKTRSSVAKECINRVCEHAKIKPVDEGRKVDKKVLKVIGEVPILQYTGVPVNLNISSSSLTLTSLGEKYVIAGHEMSQISFASLGDNDAQNFIGYVAKDANNLRVCYVLKCANGIAQDILSTIGQAFETRFHQFVNKCPVNIPESTAHATRDYYNDLPGKVPPDITDGPSLTPNLIDLHTDGVYRPNHDYVNDSIVRERDVFDLQPFTNHSIGAVPEKIEDPLTQLENETWFHGQMNRVEAESLLKKDGDFLVREHSNTAQRQFVLSGMSGSNKIHLLLIDPDGIIRTKHKIFNSVSELVEHHYENSLPIISAENAFVLRRKISRALVS